MRPSPKAWCSLGRQPPLAGGFGTSLGVKTPAPQLLETGVRLSRAHTWANAGGGQDGAPVATLLLLLYVPWL